MTLKRTGEAVDTTQVTNRANAPRRLLRSILAVGVLASVAGVGAFSAFSATTDNSGNTFQAGTVAIGDNDAGSALFNVSGMDPSDPPRTRCIVTTYTGTLPSTVRLYGATTGTGLADYLNVKVTRGTISSPTFSSCAGFTADAADYRGLGAGVLFDGTLQAYPDDYGAALVDPATGAPESWTTGEAHAYRFDVDLQNNDAAQGKDATQTFTWEARSS